MQTVLALATVVLLFIIQRLLRDLRRSSKKAQGELLELAVQEAHLHAKNLRIANECMTLLLESLAILARHPKARREFLDFLLRNAEDDEAVLSLVGNSRFEDGTSVPSSTEGLVSIGLKRKKLNEEFFHRVGCMSDELQEHFRP